MEFINKSTENNSAYAIYERSTVTMTSYVECKLPLGQGIVLVIINILLAIVGTFGNILIIMAVLKSPRLRQKPSNFLLLSLAVADLLVTMVAQPLFTASISLKTFAHQCHREIDLVYVIAAPLASSSSVFHLAVISIDRSLSALMPHKHRAIIKKGLKVMLCICWGLSALVVCILVIFPQSTSAVYIALLLCLIVMIVAYGMILYKILANRVVNVPASTARDRAMEKRVSGTVAIIIALFTLCWIPLIVFHLSHSIATATATTYWWIRTLYLANSSMNFIVYSLRIKLFRTAYIKIINRSLRKFGKLLPKKCRCQCLDSLNTRNFSQSTQHTPMSPISTAAPVPLNIIRKDDQEPLTFTQDKGEADRYVMQQEEDLNQTEEKDMNLTSQNDQENDILMQKEQEKDMSLAQNEEKDILIHEEQEKDMSLAQEEEDMLMQKEQEKDMNLTSQNEEEKDMNLTSQNEEEKDMNLMQEEQEQNVHLLQNEEIDTDLTQKEEETDVDLQQKGDTDVDVTRI